MSSSYQYSPPQARQIFDLRQSPDLLSCSYMTHDRHEGVMCVPSIAPIAESGGGDSAIINYRLLGSWTKKRGHRQETRVIRSRTMQERQNTYISTRQERVSWVKKGVELHQYPREPTRHDRDLKLT